MQLVGVAHPNPFKAAQFRSVDLLAGRGAVHAAKHAGVQHFVYVMKAYVKGRAECEELIRLSEMNATILRPRYVLGPRRRWPYALTPIYLLLSPEGTNTGLAVEKSRTVGGLVPVRRAKSKVQLSFGLAAHRSSCFSPNTVFREKSGKSAQAL